MSTAASAIISRVRNQMIDTGTFAPPRWTDSELLQWISDGQRTIVSALPRTSHKRAVTPLVAGTRQTIPTDGYMYLTAHRNMGASGTTPGTIMFQTPRELMDAQYPLWHAATAVPAPTLVIFDVAEPTVFYVSPPADGTTQIDLSYAANPVELVTTADLLVVHDIYGTPLFDYVMWRACQKDSDYAPGQQTAATYLAAFTAFLAALLKDPLTAATQQGKT